MRPFLPLLLCLGLTACLGDETVSGYAPGPWRLTAIDETPVGTGITLNLSERGEISGSAPCNHYSATQTAPYPWVGIGPIAATRRACPERELEQRYFAALSAMTLAEVSGPVLILTGDDGRRLDYELAEN